MIGNRVLSPALVLLAIAAGLGGGGCAERLLEIRTDPPGAEVTVNGEPITVVNAEGELEPAVTPVDVPFVYYGTFDIRVRHPDALSAQRMVSLTAPFYAYPPLDLFVEALLPIPLRDHYLVEFDLEPIPALAENQTSDLMRRMQDSQSRLLGPIDAEITEASDDPMVEPPSNGSP